MRRLPCVYILTNKNNTVLYTGVSSNLPRRIRQHKEKVFEGFTKRYNVDRLVYFETFPDMYTAISREKQIKSWPRKRKEELIKKLNPEWKDLADEVLRWGE